MLTDTDTDMVTVEPCSAYVSDISGSESSARESSARENSFPSAKDLALALREDLDLQGTQVYHTTSPMSSLYQYICVLITLAFREDVDVQGRQCVPRLETVCSYTAPKH
jgi:hypothetical protein